MKKILLALAFSMAPVVAVAQLSPSEPKVQSDELRSLQSRPAVIDGTLVTNAAGIPVATQTMSIAELPYQQVLVNQYGVHNWLRDFGRQGGGSAWYNYGHGNWNSVQTALNYNPTEWQIYPSSGQGKARCANPGVDGVVVREAGTPFDQAWVGRAGFYIVPSGQISGAQTVASVRNGNTLTLSTPCRWSGSNTFQWVTTSNVGVVDIDGPSVTWVSGQPFNVFATGPGAWRFNGVAGFTCTNVTMKSATCNTKGSSKGAPYLTDVNIDDEIVALNLQKVLGVSEENLSIKAHASGFYSIKPQHSGQGTLWPLLIGAGNYPADHSQRFQIGVYPTGDLSLGGVPERDTIRIPAQTGQYKTNFILAQPGQSANAPFAAPSLSVRPCSSCSEASIGLGIDTFGGGAVRFTSQSFKVTEFLISGGGGQNYMSVASGDRGPTITVLGASANADLEISARGSGSVRFNSPVKVIDISAAGTIRADGGFSAGGVAGQTTTVTVRNATGTGTCTMVFTSGLKTGGTC